MQAEASPRAQRSGLGVRITPASRPRLLTVREVATLYGVSGLTAFRWVKRGYFDAIQLPGGHWRIYEDSCHR